MAKQHIDEEHFWSEGFEMIRREDFHPVCEEIRANRPDVVVVHAEISYPGGIPLQGGDFIPAFPKSTRSSCCEMKRFGRLRNTMLSGELFCKIMHPKFGLPWPAVRHPGESRRFILTALLLYLTLAFQPMAAQSAVDEGPEANPGRPTVSTPATITPVGYLQFETGFVPAYQSPEFSSLFGLTEVMKVSVAPRLELVASAEPIAHFTAEGRAANRVADIFLGAQFVLYHGEGAKPTLAVSYFHRAYDGGAPEFDFGSPTNSLLLLASADVKGFHYDANAFFTELEQGPVRRGQFGQSLTISHQFLRRFTLSGEVWHFTQPFLRSNVVGNLWAVSYLVRKTLVVDAGFNHGLTGTSTKSGGVRGVYLFVAASSLEGSTAI